MSHRLDATVREWRILSAVRPLFAVHLRWKLTDPRVDGAADDVATEINIDKWKNIFSYEMREMRVKLRGLPDYDLSPQSFQLCLRTLSHLLAFLESIVEGCVLESPDGRPEEADDAQTGVSWLPSSRWPEPQTHPLIAIISSRVRMMIQTAARMPDHPPR